MPETRPETGRRTGRPVIGITACTRMVGGESAQVVIDRYVSAAMCHADAAAFLIPAHPELMAPRDIADRIDGLLLTGSPSNVEPWRYGAANGEGPFDARRDAMSNALIEAMIARSRPVFGICRGLQEINVAFGGSLDGSLGDPVRDLAHHAPADASLEAMFGHAHPVRLAPGGVLAEAFGTEQLVVNSVHYQGVDRLGTGLAVEATAEDGIVEAVAAEPNGAPVLAVQWHPEWQVDAQPHSRLFFSLFGRALRGERLQDLREISN